MEFNKIRKIAIDMGINTYKLNKTDLIRAIQKSEKSMQCYGRERVEYCNEKACLWRDNCLALYRYEKHRHS